PEQPVCMEAAQIVWPAHVIDPFSNTIHCTDGTDDAEETDGTEETEVTQEILCSSVPSGSSVSSVLVCAKIQSIEDAIALALPHEEHANHWHLFTLARAVKTLERQWGTPYSAEKRREIFGCWYDQARPFVRSNRTREDY